ncbi:Conserved Hypothetical protein [Teredinibacter turnerae T7901]|uniref:Lipopolysaccharide assembly protein A domain-containing protein n=1 Tax=Teredinibacter turnerae (strain ATCC 39867 / T7901) TaxID=377629 RepID=C5BSJ9_TERTT|nr:LapA family protein [Teredinibacter turnerae]ACR13987.1 Conserved Hypothetical protein [Teredinibacter turnerae T7901]
MFARIYRWFRRLFILVWLLLVCAIAGWIAWANADLISVNLFAIQFPKLSIGFYLCFTFAFGILLGWFGTLILANTKLLARKRELNKAKKEVDKLRAAQLSP